MKVLVALLVLLGTAACNRPENQQPRPASPEAAGQAVPGDPARGMQLAAQYGCNVCHVMPGVGGPQGALGPSLAGVAARPTLSFGTVTNTPANLAQFIANPASLNPRSNMPPIGLAPNEAQDIAAYLMTLR